MKFLTKYENIEAYSNEAFRLPYPNVSLVKGLPNKKSFYREEPAWVKCVYEIPSEAFESTSAVTVLNSVPGYINDYKINGVYGEVEPLRVEEGVEVEVFQPYTMEGMQFYLPTTDACFLTSDLTTETEFTLSRPLNQTDIIIEIIYNGNEIYDMQPGGTVGDFGEQINGMFSFRSDTVYTYCDSFIELVKEQASIYGGMKLGFFFANSEWYDNPLEAPSLITTMVTDIVHGGVEKIEVLPSMLDENNKVVIEYGLSQYTNTINSTFRNIDYLKEIDFTKLSPKIVSKRRFNIASESFVDCTILETVKIGNHIDNIGFSTFDGCVLLPVIDGIRYADTYCVGTIDNTITSFSLKEGTKWIGSDAFSNCKGLTGELVIPDSIIGIGNGAFSNCSGLTSVVIPDSATNIGEDAFFRCLGLTNVVFGSGMTSIGQSAFYGCSGLTSVVIPDSVTKIGGEAFADCYNLVSMEIGSGVTSIGDSAFRDCSGLTGELVIPDSVTSIGSDAFQNCSGLTSVEIGSRVTSIGDSAFYHCSGLTGELIIPNSVTSIGENAFEKCSGLTSVEIGSRVTSIGERAFAYCWSLKTIVVSNNNINYDSRENCNCLIKTSTNTLLQGSNNSVIPDSVTNIVDYAFAYCSGLTSVTIPDLVTSIGNNVFYQCKSLHTVVIGSGCTSIGDEAFSGCDIDEITCHATIPPLRDDFAIAPNNHGGLLRIPIGSDYSSWLGTESNTDLGFWNWFVQEIGTELPELTLDGYDVAMLVQSITTGSTSICNKTSDIAEIKINDIILDSVPMVHNFDTPFKWNVVRIKYKNGITSIPLQNFLYCKRIYSVKINNTITSIGSEAFMDTGLNHIIIPDSVTNIDERAFYYCPGLKSVKLGNGVTSIGNEAFLGCSTLQSIVIPDSVTSIGSKVFYSCDSLELIKVQPGNIVYDSRENCNCLIETSTNTLIQGSSNSFIPDSVTSIGSNAFHQCTGLTSVVIPDSVTSIGDSAFYQCSGLKSVVIGNGVTSIGDNAFYQCSELKTVVIPDSVTSIGDEAFLGCHAMTSIVIGSGVTSIGSSVFNGCSRLTEINCHALTAPSISKYTFQSVKSNGILYVPSGSDYSSWMGTSSYYLGYYKWKLQYIS